MLVPRLVAAPPTLDLGVIGSYQTKNLRTLLRKDGSTVIVIDRAAPGCSCTSPEDISGVQIPPGGTRELKLDFNPFGKSGDVRETVRVLYDSGKSILEFVVAARVQDHLTVSPPHILIERFGTTEPLPIPITLASLDGASFTIKSIEPPPELRCEAIRPDVPDVRHTLLVQSTQSPATERVECAVTLKTDSPVNGVIRIPVMILHRSALVADPSSINLLDVKPDSPKPFTVMVSRHDLAPFAIERVETDPPSLRVEQIKKMGDRTVISLIFNATAAAEAKRKGTIRFFGDISKSENIEVPFCAFAGN